jgi:hypothetical protein
VEVEVYETGRGDLLLQAGERAQQRADLPRSPLQNLLHRRPVDPLEHERLLAQLDPRGTRNSASRCGRPPRRSTQPSPRSVTTEA